MDAVAVATVTLATITAALGYLSFKSQRLPSEQEVREEILDSLNQKYTIPTPLAARRHDEVHWDGDFHFTIENVDVKEVHSRWKWLPGRGFTGKAMIEIKFHEREPPTERELYDSFLGAHSAFEQINRQIDHPQFLNIRLDTANPDTICGHVMGSFQSTLMEIALTKDNPDIDAEWLSLPQNLYLGYKDGNIYDIMGERVVLPLLYTADSEIPDNIPRQKSADEVSE